MPLSCLGPSSQTRGLPFTQWASGTGHAAHTGFWLSHALQSSSNLLFWLMLVVTLSPPPPHRHTVELRVCMLQEARGGEVAVRQGVVSQRPIISVQPVDVFVDEGGTAQFSVSATVSMMWVMFGLCAASFL